MRRGTARQRDPAAGTRAVRVAADDAAGHGPALSVHRMRARVAPGHQPCRLATGETVAARTAVGAGRDRGPAPHRCSCGRRARGVVEHRERRGPGRRKARAHRRSRPVRRRRRGRSRRARVASHPPRGQVRHRDHRPDRGARRTGPARLLDLVEGRSKQVFKTWIAGRPQRATRSTTPAGPCTPEPTCSPTSRLLDCGSCSRAMLTSRSRQPGGSTSA